MDRRWTLERLPNGIHMLLALLLFPPLAARAEPPQDHPGDVYEIRLITDTETSGKGSGTSHDGWMLTEKVITLRDGGAELEFDLPASTPAQERAIAWQYPARVFRAPGRQLTLLNTAEAEQRLNRWLGEQGRGLCGHWAFGWTAQYFDCDPESVLQMLEPYLRPAGLSDGALYREAAARVPARLRVVKGSAKGSTFVAEMEIDPEIVRRRLAQSDVAIAEIMHKPSLTLDAALAAHKVDLISGTLVVTFETDADGRPTQRKSVTQIDIIGSDGLRQHENTKQNVDWRLLSR